MLCDEQVNMKQCLKALLQAPFNGGSVPFRVYPSIICQDCESREREGGRKGAREGAREGGREAEAEAERERVSDG